MEKSEINLIRFAGKTYTLWSFHLQFYLEGKEMWGHISGSDPKRKENTKKLSSWNTKDAKIKTWILGHVEPHFILNPKPYKTTKKMREYLKKVCQRGNHVRHYQLQFEIAQYTQGTSCIQDYYSGFLSNEIAARL